MTSIGRQVLNRWGLLAVALAAVLATVLAIQPVFGQASPPSAPTWPTDGQAVAVGPTTVELTWTAPAGTIVGYKIQRSTATPEKWVDVTADTGNDKVYYTDTDSSLAGKTVVYRVAAINSLNTGPYSVNSSAATLPRPGREPDAPTQLTAKVSPTAAGIVMLSWTAPPRAASATSGYKVEWSKDGQQPWAPIAPARDAADIDTVDEDGETGTPVPPGTTRYYRVAATNTQGTGPYTTADVKVTTRPANVPNQPTLADAGVVAVGLTTVELTWTANTTPVPAGAPPISGYKVERSTDNGTTWTEAKADTGNDKLHYTDSHSSLAGKTVRYRVAAINSLGAGVFSEPPTAGKRLPTAGREPDAPTGLTATATSTTAITVSWTAPARTGQSVLDTTTPYVVHSSPDGKQPWTPLTTSGTGVSHDDTGLTQGATRYYRVAATNAQGTGPYTTAKVGDTAGVPGAPTIADTDVEPVGLTTVELSWTAPTGTTVTGYKIERSTVSGTTPTWVTAKANTGNDKTYYRDTHSSLAGKTNVRYQVTSIGVNGPGSSAATTAGVTLPTTGNQPGAPTGLKAEVSPTDFGIIDLSWNTPARGDAPTAGYVVQWSKEDKHPWMPIAPVHSGTDTIATDGTSAAPVPPGTTRYYRVAANKGTGATDRGPYSASVRVTTPKAGLPGASGWPLATDNPLMAVGLTTVELRWTKPTTEGLGSITGYKIERSTDGGTTWAVAANNEAGVVVGTTVHYADTHSSLAGKTKVTYRVAAINRIGTGPVSSPMTADSPPVRVTVTLPVADKYPGAPTGLTVTATSLTTATISWTAPEGKPEAANYTIQYSAKGELPWADVPATDGGDGHVVTHTPTTATTGTIAATNGVTHHYRVAATIGTAGDTADPLKIGPYSAPATAGAQITISGRSTVSYGENDTDAVGTYEVRGENAATARWTLEGADMSDFTLSPTSGATTMLRFRSPPDYEAPVDANTDNVYMVTVKATVGTESDTHEVRVTVTDDANEETTLQDRYDTNPQNGKIDLDEVLDAINDYFTAPIGSVINLEQVLDLIGLYFDGLRS